MTGPRTDLDPLAALLARYYRTAMVTDHRLLIRITLTRLYGWIPG